jgi:hypothetical protein
MLGLFPSRQLVQVDGVYIGEYSEVEFGVTPRGLLAVA